MPHFIIKLDYWDTPLPSDFTDSPIQYSYLNEKFILAGELAVFMLPTRG